MSFQDELVLADLPALFETQRLIIRVPRAGDGEQVNRATHDSLDELRPWMPWVHPAPTVEDTERVLREAAGKFILRQDFWLLFFLKETGEFAGASGLHPVDLAVPSFEIGYWIKTSLSGHGYVTEAVLGITDYGFDKLRANRIQIHCSAANHRSEAVMKRAGYRYEAQLRNDRRSVDGELQDTIIYGKTRMEWESER